MAWTYFANAFTNPLYDSADQGAFPTNWATAGKTMDVTTDSAGNPTGIAAGQYLALLAVEPSSLSPYVATRPLGSGSGYFSTAGIDAHGACLTQLASAGGDIFCQACVTDANGEIDLKCSLACNGKIYLLGVADATAHALAIIAAAAMPSVNTDVDISAAVSGAVLACVEYAMTGGTSNEIGARQKGDADEYLLANNLQAANRCRPRVVGVTELITVPTDVNSVYTHKASVVVPNVNATLIGSVGLSLDGSVIKTGVPPVYTGAWEEIDTGLTSRQLCVFKLIQTTAVATGIVAIRAKGDTKDYMPSATTTGAPMGVNPVRVDDAAASYLITHCDDNGKVEWASYTATDTVQLTLLGNTAPPVPTPSGERGRSTGAMPLGLTGPYPITAALRAAGYLWRDEFISSYLSAKQGLALTGGPSFSDGLVLDGATQYGIYAGFPAIQSFSETRQFWIIQFSPDFEADDDLEHVFFDGEDTDTAEMTVWGVRKMGAADSNVLRLTIPGSDNDIALATYQASWVTGGKNTLVVNVGKTGGTEVLLNGTQIFSSALLIQAQGVAAIYLGVSADESSGFFDGTIHKFAFGLGSLTAAEAEALESDW